MIRIFKYVLSFDAEQVIQMPKSASIITVQEQNGKIALWAVVDDTAPMHSRAFRLVGTGHPVTHPLEEAEQVYKGTVQLMGGTLVLHVFEVRR